MAVLTLSLEGFPARAHRREPIVLTFFTRKRDIPRQEYHERTALHVHGVEDAWISACRDPFERSLW